MFMVGKLSSSFLGSATKPNLDSTVDEPLKKQKPQDHHIPLKGSKASISESFWMTSNCDMDISTVQSQVSISSGSTSTHDTHGAGSSNAPSEFVNHGLLLWNQTRQQWIGNSKCANQPQQLREPKLSWNATYDSLLGSSKPFPRPIPLAEMVDFLVDIWEQEGMYD
ncbi:hypothetical protein ACH5RR_024606 [Cinchona calisaya]|uniref:Gag1-like clamp domain-containing protein n=1 Tax=Cinchona calisaya TaxID=153742 RepID=A0ABD2YX68_9GENT